MALSRQAQARPKVDTDVLAEAALDASERQADIAAVNGCLVTPAGTAALFLSALTAAVLLLHISHSHDAAWRPSGGRPEQQPPEQQQPLSDGDYLAQLLCGIGGSGGRDSRSSQDARGGGSLSGGGSGGGGGGGAAGTLRRPAVRQRSWAAAHIEHDLRRWRRRGCERSALDAVVANASYQARPPAHIDPHSARCRLTLHTAAPGGAQ